MAALGQRLAALRFQRSSIDPAEGAGVEWNAFASAIKGPNKDGKLLEGTGLVRTAQKRHDRTPPERQICNPPKVVKARVEDCRDEAYVLLPQSFGHAIRWLLSPKESAALLGEEGNLATLQNFVDVRFPEGISRERASVSLKDAIAAAQAEASAIVAIAGSASSSGFQVRCARRSDPNSEMLIAMDDGLRAQGVLHPSEDWRDWAQRAVEEELVKMGCFHAGDGGLGNNPEVSPYMDLRQLPGHSAFVRVCNRAYYLIVIRVYVRRGRLPDKQVQEAIELCDRLRVGDARLHALIEANANSAPAAAQDFVLGSAEGQRQRVARVQHIQLKRRKAMALLQKQAQALDALAIRLDSGLDSLNCQIAQVETRFNALETGMQALQVLGASLLQQWKNLPRQLALATWRRVRPVARGLRSLKQNLLPTFRLGFREFLRLRRSRPTRGAPDLEDFPDDQLASSFESGPQALTLATVVSSEDSALPFAAYRQYRSQLGVLAKKERLRCHALGPLHPDYVPKPLLWTRFGACVEGGGRRYLYTQDQRALLRRVLVEPGEGQAASLLQKMQRSAAEMSPDELAIPWPSGPME